MNDQPAHQPSQPSELLKDGIDRICEDFKEALSTAAKKLVHSSSGSDLPSQQPIVNPESLPLIEEFLEYASQAQRSVLFCRLLVIELDLWRSLGHAPSIDAYLKRFPKQHESVQKAFQTSHISNERAIVVSTVDYHQSTVASDSAGQVKPAPLGDLGDYELLEEIARGGMGVVYKARQKKANRIVALKMILSGRLADENAVKRFYTEVESAANLDHPNIVPIFDVGGQDGQHFYSMGFIDGCSLKHRIDDGPLRCDESAQLVAAIADAIDYAHRQGIIHRDLKPHNVLIDKSGAPRVTDFGLAKQIESNSDLTGTGQILGTPCYMSPEQAAGDSGAISPLSDVYSLGAILYELLTGRPPFIAATVMETLSQVLEREALPPRSLNPSIDRDIQTICLKCLEKEPSARYESAAALAADLTRYLDGEPILARPASLLEKTWRRAKKRPLVTGLVVALLLVSLAGGVTAWLLSRRTRDLSQEVETTQQEKSLVEKQKSRVERERNAAAADAKVKGEETKKAREEKYWQEYTTDMQSIDSAWQDGRMATAGELLRKHLPKNEPASSDLRGPEWYYWDFRLRNTSQLLPRADGRSAAVSGDGHVLAMADETYATIWDLRTLQQLQRWRIVPGRPTSVVDPSDRHSDFDHSVAFSPNCKLCAATTFRIERQRRLGSVRVWDVESGDERLAIVNDQLIAGRAVCFSPDERLVMAGGYGYSYKAWNLETGEEVKPRLRVGDPPNPGFVKPGTPWSGSAVVWDMAFWGNILMLRCDLLGPAFPDWPQAKGHVTPRVQSDIPRRLGRDPERQRRTMYGYQGNELFAAVRNVDDTLDLYHMANPRINGIEIKRLEGGPVTCVTTRDRWLAAAGRDRVIRIWQVHFLKAPRELRGSEQTIKGMTLSPDGKLLVTFPGTRIWRLDKAAEFQLPLPPFNPNVITQIDSPGKKFSVTHRGGSVKLIDNAGDRVIADLPCEQFVGAWFCPNDRRVAVTLSHNKRFATQLWDLAEERRIAELPMFGRAGIPHAFSGGVFSSDGRWLLGHGCLWDAETGEQILDCGNQLTTAVAFSRTSDRAAFVGPRETRVWDLIEARQIARLPRGGNGVAFQDEGTQLILAGQGVSVWDLDSEREIPTTFGPAAADSVALSRDGRRLFLLRNDEIRIFSNRDWNHLLTLRCRTPRTAAELEPLFDAVAQSINAARNEMKKEAATP